MRIKEGQLLELKNGQTISAEEEIARFATVLLSAGLRGYLLHPQHYEEHRALVEAGGEDVIWQIAREMYDGAVILEDIMFKMFGNADVPEEVQEALLRGVKEAYSEKAKEDKQ